MAVKLRLRRMGRKKLPLYAVVATDERSPRDGRFIEDLGRYQPLQEPATTDLKRDRVLYWLSQGAQPSDTVRSLLRKEGILHAFALQKKGKSEEEVAQEVEALRARRAEKSAGKQKLTAADRRRQALEAERQRVAAEEAKAAKERAEAEARAKAEAEEAQRRAAEERAAAAEEARVAQEAANAAQVAEDQAAAGEAATEQPAAEAAPEAPAAEAAPDSEAADEAAPEKEA